MSQSLQPPISLRDRRKAAGVSLVMAACLAGVSVGLTRLFEADPQAVADTVKRARLADVYAVFGVGGAQPSP